MKNVLKTDIPYETARRAYLGISFSPERRAEQAQEGYYTQMEQTWNELKPLAKTDEKKNVLDTEFEKYRAGYVSRYLAYLNAKAQTISPMITGGSNFPVNRNRKKMATEDNRFQELVEFDEKFIKRLKRELSDSGPVLKSDPKGIEKLQTQLENAEKIQEFMREANKIVRKKKLDHDKKVELLMELGGIKLESALNILEPDFLGRPGFASYQLSNNSANIRRLKKRIAEFEHIQTESSETVEFDGGEVVDNVGDNRVQILFDEKPNRETIQNLKRNGFRWSPRAKAWQRNRGFRANELVEQFTGVNLNRK